MILRDRHYRILKSTEAGIEIPQEWLRETQEPKPGTLRGAGGDEFQGHCSVVAGQHSDSLSLPDSAPGGLSFASATPSPDRSRTTSAKKGHANTEDVPPPPSAEHLPRPKRIKLIGKQNGPRSSPLNCENTCCAPSQTPEPKSTKDRLPRETPHASSDVGLSLASGKRALSIPEATPARTASTDRTAKTANVARPPLPLFRTLKDVTASELGIETRSLGVHSSNAPVAFDPKKIPPDFVGGRTVPKGFNERKYQPPKRSKVKSKSLAHRTYIWKCPMCAEERKGVWTKICQLRKTHWNRAHLEVPYDVFLIKPRSTPVVAASTSLPKDQRAFQCPCCEAGLPTLGTREMTKAVTAHRKEAHPDLNTKTWMGLMAKQRFKGVRKRDNLEKAAVKRHDATRNCKFKTHRPIELDLSQEELGATKNGTPRQWWCADCLHIIAGYNARPKTSTCAQNRRSQRAPHAVAYAWKTLQKRNNIEPLRRALGPWVKRQLGLT